MKTGLAKKVSERKRVNLSCLNSLKSGSKPFFHRIGHAGRLSFPHSVLGHGKKNRFSHKAARLGWETVIYYKSKTRFF